MNIKQDQELKSETNCNFLAQLVEKLRLNKDKGKYNFFVIFRKKGPFSLMTTISQLFLNRFSKAPWGLEGILTRALI